ncbi:DMT family transporter [Sphaerisporangium sp. NPDC005288]|uniref:DMT family transporter n=1 Tax=Sphaerisporangium sp. NPDC005288 TaxID=3155114 RepID=UPI0033B71CA5
MRAGVAQGVEPGVQAGTGDGAVPGVRAGVAQGVEPGVRAGVARGAELGVLTGVGDGAVPGKPSVPGGRMVAGASRWAGTSLAGLGVVAFSGTLTATAFALRGFDPYFVAVGRAAVAAVAAVVCLLAAGAAPLPPRAQFRSYAAIAFGVVFGFPLFSGLALAAGASVSHAAVVVGLLPAATAVFAVLRAGERPRPLFWVASAAGAASVTVFTLTRGGGRLAAADLLMVAALVCAAVGYTEGGRLARHTAGWRVISHALVLAAPVTVPVAVILWFTTAHRLSTDVMAGFAYVSLVSMFLGFIPWYAGLARGGIARAGQTQLLQPLLTLLLAWWLLRESLDPATLTAAVAVLVCVALTQRAR